ncbi:hypothetical protein SLEP1_g51791 [Rubroshorea leprosula]|uniref:Uncharacterized protein n=1 Tax=Rubroshorea leprosula TaxID=152421 RepID=A0AAV5M4B3_9ROSI|nr:hypothetical protein SLEP1_g51791 [Rubroshorea leprosula]
MPCVVLRPAIFSAHPTQRKLSHIHELTTYKTRALDIILIMTKKPWILPYLCGFTITNQSSTAES